ncbi:hypothetical protein J3R03_003484 [Actinoplanes couchii]|uniref:Uncharacterized protein n=1 Tax=Actinoplanes couchii TaxID=403638 RepID=A0ABQ3XLW5_9ACTN|nr:hypothetical protein [Actinoplanes couchii]GID59503.1 hypothetical protein Aco03nite_079070 [Actinoplanes couchii]
MPATSTSPPAPTPTAPPGEAYHRFAEDYYQKPVALDAVREVFASAPLTPSLVRRLNPGRSATSLLADLSDIGYPTHLA